MTALTHAALAADLAERAFAAPVSASHPPRRIGAEIELIPVEQETKRRCWVLQFLRTYGARHGWREGQTPKGSRCFTPPEGGAITFEPGGQVEYSTPPAESPTALLALLRSVVPPLQADAALEGIDLLAVGIDPFNSIEGAPLFVRGRRYERMAAYFAQQHPAGARMMRQTAAFQVSLDFGDEPWLRWRVLNAAAPYFVAIFANSPVYAGKHTHCVSARADVWRAIDHTRTGLPYAADAVRGYLRFALAAPAILLPTIDGRHRSFDEWLARANPTLHEWDDHLSTLFPEVRPRGRLELRSTDAIPPDWYAAPIALAVGLTYHPAALRAALELLGDPDASLLERAGRVGLRDARMARTATDLFELALQGCEALGTRYFDPIDIDGARVFFETYTRAHRCPADDQLRTNSRVGSTPQALQTVLM